MTGPEKVNHPMSRGQSDTSLSKLVRAFGKIGLLSFGGPAGQIALMHRELVETRNWLDEARFLHAMNYCMLLPGPEAMQLATYAGWLLRGWRGGLIAGVLFVLPGVVAIMALSWIYVLAGNIGWIAAAFFGLKAAVLAIVAQALIKIARKTLSGMLAVAIAVSAFLAIYVLGLPFPLIVLGAALIGAIAAREDAPKDIAQAPVAGRSLLATLSVWLALWLVPVVLLVLIVGRDHTFAQVAVYFSQMAVLTFGGAYAVLAWVAQAAVEGYGWLTPEAMLDGLALAETTPGPLIMVTQFVGFMAGFSHPGGMSPLLAGTLAGLITTWVTFAPCFLWILVGAPFAERLRANAALAGALKGVTAAVVGVIANLALWFALHTLFAQIQPVFGVDVPVWSSLNPVAAGLALIALIAAFAGRNGQGVGPGGLIVGAALAGVALDLAGLI